MGDRRRKVAQNGTQMQQKTPKPIPPEPSPIRNICVYCGSNTGTNPAYSEKPPARWDGIWHRPASASSMAAAASG